MNHEQTAKENATAIIPFGDISPYMLRYYETVDKSAIVDGDTELVYLFD